MDLGLTADQIAKISDSFHAGASAGGLDKALVDAHMQRLAAFRDEAFDAKSLEGGRAVAAHLAARGAARMARFYEAVDPALTPEQRAKLAAMLREHATHNDAAVAAH
jgi:Spy/CpxP family protein refolding chaperone